MFLLQEDISLSLIATDFHILCRCYHSVYFFGPRKSVIVAFPRDSTATMI